MGSVSASGERGCRSLPARYRRAAPYLVAGVLFVASALKFFDPYVPLAAGTVWVPAGIPVALIATFESLLAWWLVRGWLPQWSRMTAIATFGVFGLLQIANLFSGEESCGCFGFVELPAAWMIGLDVFLIIALIWAIPPTATRRPRALEFVALGALFAGAWFVSLRPLVNEYAAFYVFGKQPTRGGRDIGRGISLSFDNIPGETLLSQHACFSLIQPRRVLNRGRWALLLVRSECRRCREATRSFTTLQSSRSFGDWQFGIVDVAKAGEPGEFNSPAAGITAYRLPGFDERGKISWVGRTPLYLMIEDGKLVDVFYDLESLQQHLRRRNP